jgi:hypothetical protein
MRVPKAFSEFWNALEPKYVPIEAGMILKSTLRLIAVLTGSTWGPRNRQTWKPAASVGSRTVLWVMLLKAEIQETVLKRCGSRRPTYRRLACQRAQPWPFLYKKLDRWVGNCEPQRRSCQRSNAPTRSQSRARSLKRLRLCKFPLSGGNRRDTRGWAATA